MDAQNYDHEQDCTVDVEFLAASHATILAWAKPQFASLARRAIFQMQRRQAIGMFSDDYRFKSWWDEYCHEVQSGPFMEEWADEVIEICSALVMSIDRPTLLLLNIAAVDKLLDFPTTEDLSGIDEDLISKVVLSEIDLAAACRNLGRFYKYGEDW